MVEKDLYIIQKEFRDIVGPLATAEITADGADRSARTIINLQQKLREGKTQPIHLLQAAIATSQLIERWSQLNQHLIAGTIKEIDDAKTVGTILYKVAVGNLSEEEDMELSALVYVASPSAGANNAMDVLSKLRAIYPDISLRQPQR